MWSYIKDVACFRNFPIDRLSSTSLTRPQNTDIYLVYYYEPPSPRVDRLYWLTPPTPKSTACGSSFSCTGQTWVTTQALNWGWSRRIRTNKDEYVLCNINVYFIHDKIMCIQYFNNACSKWNIKNVLCVESYNSLGGVCMTELADTQLQSSAILDVPYIPTSTVRIVLYTHSVLAYAHRPPNVYW